MPISSNHLAFSSQNMPHDEVSLANSQDCSGSEPFGFFQTAQAGEMFIVSELVLASVGYCGGRLFRDLRLRNKISVCRLCGLALLGYTPLWGTGDTHTVVPSAENQPRATTDSLSFQACSGSEDSFACFANYQQYLPVT